MPPEEIHLGLPVCCYPSGSRVCLETGQRRVACVRATPPGWACLESTGVEQKQGKRGGRAKTANSVDRSGKQRTKSETGTQVLLIEQD